MDLQMRNGKVTIDGKTFSGNSFQINGTKVIVDGVEQDGDLVGNITVTVHGDVDVLENKNGNVNAKNVGSIRTTNGKVTCDDVSGDVKTTNGDVNCRKILGKVTTTNGDIN
jgi:hypothetical protein